MPFDPTKLVPADTPATFDPSRLVPDDENPQPLPARETTWDSIVKGLSGTLDRASQARPEAVADPNPIRGSVRQLVTDVGHALDFGEYRDKPNEGLASLVGNVADLIGMGGPSATVAEGAAKAAGRSPAVAKALQEAEDEAAHITGASGKILSQAIPASTLRYVNHVVQQILDTTGINRGTQEALGLGSEQTGLGLQGERGIEATHPGVPVPAKLAPAAQQLGIGLGRPQGAEQLGLGVQEAISSPLPGGTPTTLPLGAGYMQEPLFDIPAGTRGAVREVAELGRQLHGKVSPFYALDKILNTEGRIQLADSHIDQIERSLAEEQTQRPFVSIAGGAEDPNLLERAKQLTSELMGNAGVSFHDLGLNAKQLLMSSANSVLRSLGPNGTKLAGLFDKFWDRFVSLAGGDSYALQMALKGLGNRTAQLASLDKIRAVREWALNPLAERFAPPKLTGKEQAVKEFLDNYLGTTMQTRVKDLESKLGMESGTIVPQWENSTSYWPRRILREKFGEGTAGYGDAVIRLTDNLLARDSSLDARDARVVAMKILERATKPFGNFAKEREMEWIPYEFRKPALDELRDYIHGGNRWLSHIENFGILTENAQKIIDSMKSSGENFEYAERWLREVMGLRNVADSAMERDFVSRLNGLQMASKGMFVSLRHAPQALLNGLVNAGIMPTVKAFVKGFSNFNEMQAFAGRAGNLFSITQDELQRLATSGTGEMASMGKVVARATGLPWMMRANSILASGIGREWLMDAFRNNNSKLLGKVFSPEDVQRVLSSANEGAIPIDLQEQAGRWFFDKIMLPLKPGSLPIGWNDPWVKLATMFKSFHFKQTKMLWDAVVTQGLKKGNIRPLLVLGTIFPAFGELSKDAQLLMTHPRQAYQDITEQGMSPEETFTDITRGESFFLTAPKLAQGDTTAIAPFVGAYIRNLAYAGGLGLFDQLFNVMRSGTSISPAASTILGPTMSDLLNVFPALAKEWGFAQQSMGGEVVDPSDVEKAAIPLTGMMPGGQLVRPFLTQPSAQGDSTLNKFLQMLGVGR